VVDHAANLKAALENAETYFGLAIRSTDRGERELLEEIAELQIKIAERLEVLVAQLMNGTRDDF
jgi:hypothetical protein